MDASKFEKIGAQFGGHASWALWSMPENYGSTEKDGWKRERVNDLSVFAPTEASEHLSTLHTKYVLMGLNVSRGPTDKVQVFGNFHDGSAKGRDYRLRYAIHGTPLWGAYITDFFVNLVDPKASRVMSYAKKKENVQKVTEQVKARRDELKAVGADDAVLVALGNDVHSLLRTHFADRKIIKIPHYSAYIKLDEYRDIVRAAFQSEGD